MNKSNYEKTPQEKRFCECCNETFTPSRRYTRYCEKCTPSQRGKRNNVNLEEIECEVCSNKFKPQNRLVKCCSMMCSKIRTRSRLRKKNAPRECSQCDKLFLPSRSVQKFCDSPCRKAYAVIRAQERKRSGKLQRLVNSRQCDHCNTPYKPKHSRNRYCPKCTLPLRRKAKQAMGTEKQCKFCEEPFLAKGKGRRVYCPACQEKYPRTKPKKSKEPCEWCGKYFTHMRPNARFCSLSCSSSWLNDAGLGPKWNRKKLISTLVDFVQQRDHIVTLEEVSAVLGITHKVFTARGITIADVYAAAGKSMEHPFDSYFECRVYHALRKLGLGENEIERQKTFPGLVGISESKLIALDFYLPGHNILIEADGKQHHEAIHGEESFQRTQEHDRRKNEYAHGNGIPLIRINYLVTFEEAVEEIRRAVGPHIGL